jgi:hypothetical protein
MSDAKQWNTKEVRTFKVAFGTRNNRSFFSDEPPHDPAKAYKQAREMLDKRRLDGAKTWLALADQRDGGEEGPLDTEEFPLLKELATRADGLTNTTNQFLAVTVPPVLDVATKTAIDLTDEWISFEAACISAGNTMKKSGSDTKLRADLAEQALQLLDLTAELRNSAGKSGPPVGLQQVEAQLLQMTATAGDKGEGITDTLAFGDQVESCRKQLRAQTTEIAKVSGDSGATYRLAIKQMYGMDVKPSSVMGFPYEQFLDTLAMIPPDHARNSGMSEVVGEYLGLSTGGDYLDSGEGDRSGQVGGRIRINPVINFNVFGKAYKDPETGEKVRIDNWKATTLHEIGHAMDAAHGLMKSHGKEGGCGGWEEQSPLVYVQPQYQQFKTNLAKHGITEASYVSRIGGDAFDYAAAVVATGSKKPEDVRPPIEKFWNSVYDGEYYPTTQFAELDARVQLAEAGAQVLGIQLGFAFPDVRAPADFDTARTDFMQRGQNVRHLDNLTQRPAIVDPTEFNARLKDLAEKPVTKAQAVVDWMNNAVKAFKDSLERQKTELKTRTVTRWTDAVIASLPEPVDLKPYLAGDKPWNTDLSKVTIGGQRASHEAYSGDSKWWRYSSADRQGTFVSDYQWRAPGEWFAELYAISWFKKVEPPGAVAQVLRPFLFGGHLTPDQV